MAKKTGNARIILSYSIILIACSFLVIFSIFTSLIARDKFERLDKVSAAESSLDDINRTIYEMDGLIKDYIQNRDGLMSDEIRAKQLEISRTLKSEDMSQIRAITPEIMLIYKDIQKKSLSFYLAFEEIRDLPLSRPDVSAEAMILEGQSLYSMKIISIKNSLILDSDSSVQFIRGKKKMARDDIQMFLVFMLIISIAVVISLFLAIIPFIITAANGLFIPKKGMNRIMLMDYETDLYNRNYLYDTMTNYKNLSDRYDTEVGLLAVGINRFDELVAKHGKKNGHLILHSAAETLLNTCRNYDFASRYDGSEFFILTPENTPENLFLMAKRLKERMESSNIYLKNKKRVHIEVSLAIGEYREIVACYGEVQVSNLIKLMLDKMREKMRHGGGIDKFECSK